MKFKQSLRVLFAIYCLAAYAAALVLSGALQHEGIVILWGFGVVFNIIAVCTMMIMHSRDDRPIIELPLLVTYPALAYGILYSFSELASAHFWSFAGYSYFLIITGGFLAGIFLSPLICALRSGNREHIRSILKVGVQHLKEHRGIASAVLAFLAIFISLCFFFTTTVLNLHGLKSVDRLKYVVYVLVGGICVASLTYRHTRFGMLERTPRQDNPQE